MRRGVRGGAVGLCIGYPAEARDGLIEGCLRAFNPALAMLFDAQDGCEVEVQFASGNNPDFAAGGVTPVLCQELCSDLR